MYAEFTGLKPCPFCGSTNALCVIKENGEYVVCCDYSQSGCGAMAGFRESIKEAKTVWNTRTNCPECIKEG